MIHPIRVPAKINKPTAIRNAKPIARHASAVMTAPGDLTRKPGGEEKSLRSFSSFAFYPPLPPSA
jgi:hypothetical protein